MKHGYGCQKWKDGAKYEGNWKFNKACGRGKFWHVDGDIFEGEWVDDKENYKSMLSKVHSGYYIIIKIKMQQINESPDRK